MANARWYPTLTKLPDGRMLVVSGSSNCPDCATPGAAHNGIVPAPEIFDPATNTWSTVTGANLRLPLYPHMYVLPDGRIFAAATAEEAIASRVLDLNTRTWSVVDSAVRDGGSSVMYLPGKILKSGKAWNPDYPVTNSSAEAWAIDMNQTAPTWRQVGSMAFPRTQHQLTVLPDGTVLATGGSRNSDVNDTASAVLAAELWDPVTETWRTLSSGAVPRLYHSSATLLPGRARGDRRGRPSAWLRHCGIPHRDLLPAVPLQGRRGRRSRRRRRQANYGQNFFVGTPDGSTITKVALIPQPTPTHSFNSNSGYVPLTFSQTSGGLTVTGPANGNHRASGHVHALRDQRQRGPLGRLVGADLRCERLQCHRSSRRAPRKCMVRLERHGPHRVVRTVPDAFCAGIQWGGSRSDGERGKLSRRVVRQAGVLHVEPPTRPDPREAGQRAALIQGGRWSVAGGSTRGGVRRGSKVRGDQPADRPVTH